MKRIFKSLLSLLLALSMLLAVSCSEDPEVIYAEDYKGIKNVILIIGDGMGEEQLRAGELGYGRDYSFTDWTKILANTDSVAADFSINEVTDSAAGATALATGVVTFNKYAGKDTLGNDLKTVFDVAAECKKSTGFVTTDTLCGATPAGFTAHTTNRNLENGIITSQIKSGTDLLIGQYYDVYEDHADSIKKNYSYFTEYDRDAILASESALCHFEIETDAEESVTLAESSKLAIDFLSRDKQGFVLVIEQAHIDKSCHNKDFEAAVDAANSLADTVDCVMEFASGRDDTAVLITADHETCGLKVSENADEYKNKYSAKDGKTISYDFTSTYHTATPVPVYTYGFTPLYEKFDTYKSNELVKNREIGVLLKFLVQYS